MERYEIQKLRDLPIEGVAQRLGLEVARHKALCPFHDDRHPSLSFSVRRNSYRCFVCGASGGTIDLVMRHLQPACIESAEARRRALHHRGIVGLLGHALRRSQGHRHPLRHAPHQTGRGTTLNGQCSMVNGIPHVPRPRRARRTALPPVAARPALARPPPVAPRLQGLQRLLPVADDP